MQEFVDAGRNLNLIPYIDTHIFRSNRRQLKQAIIYVLYKTKNIYVYICTINILKFMWKKTKIKNRRFYKTHELCTLYNSFKKKFNKKKFFCHIFFQIQQRKRNKSTKCSRIRHIFFYFHCVNLYV